jgi:hypothetical protein
VQIIARQAVRGAKPANALPQRLPLALQSAIENTLPAPISPYGWSKKSRHVLLAW